MSRDSSPPEDLAPRFSRELDALPAPPPPPLTRARRGAWPGRLASAATATLAVTATLVLALIVGTTLADWRAARTEQSPAPAASPQATPEATPAPPGLPSDLRVLVTERDAGSPELARFLLLTLDGSITARHEVGEGLRTGHRVVGFAFDGRSRIAYLRGWPPPAGSLFPEPPLDLVLWDALTGTARTLATLSDRSAGMPLWSRDGERVIFATAGPEIGDARLRTLTAPVEVFSADVAGGVRRLARLAGDHALLVYADRDVVALFTSRTTYAFLTDVRYWVLNATSGAVLGSWATGHRLGQVQTEGDIVFASLEGSAMGPDRGGLRIWRAASYADELFRLDTPADLRMGWPGRGEILLSGGREAIDSTGTRRTVNIRSSTVASVHVDRRFSRFDALGEYLLYSLPRESRGGPGGPAVPPDATRGGPYVLFAASGGDLNEIGPTKIASERYHLIGLVRAR